VYRVVSYVVLSLLLNCQHSRFFLVSYSTHYPPSISQRILYWWWQIGPLPLLSPWFASSRVRDKMIQSRHFTFGHQSGVTQGDVHSTCIAVSGERSADFATAAHSILYVTSSGGMLLVVWQVFSETNFLLKGWVNTNRVTKAKSFVLG
jgi:hypothetical protein